MYWLYIFPRGAGANDIQHVVQLPFFCILNRLCLLLEVGIAAMICYLAQSCTCHQPMGGQEKQTFLGNKKSNYYDYDCNYHDNQPITAVIKIITDRKSPHKSSHLSHHNNCFANALLMHLSNVLYVCSLMRVKSFQNAVRSKSCSLEPASSCRRRMGWK